MGNRCVIFTSYARPGTGYIPRDGDLVLCADGGYRIALSLGVTPDKVIGDLDSLIGGTPPSELLIRAPKEKDDTDTMLCARYAIDRCCTECLIVGGIGGRLDHTLANIQTLAFLQNHNVKAEMEDSYEHVLLIKNGSRSIYAKPGTIISLFSFTEKCHGVGITGVKYPLNGAELTTSFPLGVSNVQKKHETLISVSSGTLLVIITKEPDTLTRIGSYYV